MKLAVINCSAFDDGNCALGFYERPSPSKCNRCLGRLPLLDGPAVDYVPISSEPAAWAELHLMPFAFDGNARVERVRLQLFGLRVTCSDCQEHWHKIVREKPPALTGRRDYFAWTVDRHNDVNARIGFQLMPFDVAWEFWSREAERRRVA